MVIYHYNKYMIKDILTKKNITVYKLSQETGIPYATIRDIINGKVDISKCQIGNIERIADVLQLSIDDTYKLLKQDQHLGRIKGPETKQRGYLVIKGKKYYLLYRGKYTELCEVTPITSMCITTWAGWAIDDKVNDYRVNHIIQGDRNDT